MSKQFATFYVTWRDAKRTSIGSLFADSDAYGRAAAIALQDKLNELADDGWIIHDIYPAAGLAPKQNAAFTIVAFK